MHAQVIAPRLLALALLATLAACQSPGAASSRGETVFRLQNAVMDRLITAQSDEVAMIDANRPDLAAFEEHLVDACAALNQAADISATGGAPNLLLNLRVLASLSDCEQSALAAETRLHRDQSLLGARLP